MIYSQDKDLFYANDDDNGGHDEYLNVSWFVVGGLLKRWW